MNRNRWLGLTLVALFLSAGLTFLVYRMVQRRLQPAATTMPVVVAEKKLSLGDRLDEQNVRLVNWPKGLPVEGSFSDIKQVVGRGAITSILSNEPILESKLAPKEAGAGLPAAIPDGMRAVSVKVNEVIGVAGFVLPGTRVDVIMTGTPKSNEDVASKTIIENVQVLTAGQNVVQDANGKPQNAPVVTLLVTPQQAQELALAGGVDARIQLSLRNPLDMEQKNPATSLRTALFFKNQVLAEKIPEARPAVKVKPAKRADVIVQPPAPPVVAERRTAVEVFLGQKKETLTFVEKAE